MTFILELVDFAKKGLNTVLFLPRGASLCHEVCLNVPKRDQSNLETLLIDLFHCKA